MIQDRNNISKDASCSWPTYCYFLPSMCIWIAFPLLRVIKTTFEHQISLTLNLYSTSLWLTSRPWTILWESLDYMMDHEALSSIKKSTYVTDPLVNYDSSIPQEPLLLQVLFNITHTSPMQINEPFFIPTHWTSLLVGTDFCWTKIRHFLQHEKASLWVFL